VKVNELIKRLCELEVSGGDPEIALKIGEWTFQVENVYNIAPSQNVLATGPLGLHLLHWP
jgi:hypothetical protein